MRECELHRLISALDAPEHLAVVLSLVTDLDDRLVTLLRRDLTA